MVTCQTYFLLGARAPVQLESTYGVGFLPIRYVLWSHTSPCLNLIISGVSSLPMCQTSRQTSRWIVAIMVTGLLATAAVPQALSSVYLGQPWRLGWLSASCYYMFLSVREIIRRADEQSSLSRGYQRGLKFLAIVGWNNFFVIWLLAQSGLVTPPIEHLLLGFADLFAKQLASCVLMTGVGRAADTLYEAKQRRLIEHERSRAGMLHTFARSMGHDLRTPLQALVFSLHMSETAMAAAIPHSSSDAKAKLALKHISQASSCAEMLSLIVSNLWDDELLDPAEVLSEGEILLPSKHIERVDLRDRLDAMIDLLKASPNAKSHVRLQLVVDERIPAVMCDASRVVRTLLNLIVNSLKFTSNGMVTLVLTMLELDSGHTSVRFEVSDTGRGMTEEQIAMSTRAYVHSSADENGGLGLGLAIVTKAVSSLGGELHITSPGLGHGTTSYFTLQLEVADEESPEAMPARGTEPSLGVFIADDVDIILAGACSIVSDLGHRVVATAADGEEVLAALMKHADEIDIAFVDVRLPKLFGDTAVAKYRTWEREHRSGLPPLLIYAASGDATEHSHKQHAESGFDGTLPKPVYPSTYKLLCRSAAKLQTSRSASSSALQPQESPTGPLHQTPHPHPATFATTTYTTLAEVMEILSTYEGGLEVLNAGYMISKLKFTTDLADKLLVSYAKALPRMVVQMKEKEASDEWDGTRSISSVAHSSKGAAGQVGASRLFAACDILDKAVQGGKNLQAIVALKAWYTVAAELEEVLATTPREAMLSGPITTTQAPGPTQSPSPGSDSSDGDARALVIGLLQEALVSGHEEQVRKLDRILKVLPQ